MYGVTCNKQAYVAKVQIEQQGNLVSFTWIDDCPDYLNYKGKAYATGNITSEDFSSGHPFQLQFLKIDRRGNVAGSLARTGYLFRNGELIVIQERNWRDKWFLVRAQ